MTILTLKAGFVFINDVGPVSVISITDCTAETKAHIRALRSKIISKICIEDSSGTCSKIVHCYISKMLSSDCEKHVVVVTNETMSGLT